MKKRHEWYMAYEVDGEQFAGIVVVPEGLDPKIFLPVNLREKAIFEQMGEADEDDPEGVIFVATKDVLTAWLEEQEEKNRNVHSASGWPHSPTVVTQVTTIELIQRFADAAYGSNVQGHRAAQAARFLEQLKPRLTPGERAMLIDAWMHFIGDGQTREQAREGLGEAIRALKVARRV